MMGARQVRTEALSTADEAIDALFREHGDRIVRLAYLLTADRGAAEELAQEAFVRVWRAWARIRDEGAAYAYLRKTVVNASRSLHRRRALEIRHRFGWSDEAVCSDLDSHFDVVDAIARLPRRQRACVALRFYEDLSESETARVLGITVGAVKSQTFKALRKLEQWIGDRDAD
jgi:RNA polymerase sigma-70 factor (sigma-E family)